MPPDSPSKRLTLAVLSSGLDSGYGYNLQILAGAVSAAKQHDVSVFWLSGGHLGDSDVIQAQRNIIYQLVSRERIDGLLIMTGTLGNLVELPELTRFCERYHPLPMVSLPRPTPSIPHLLVDNAKGIRDLVAHLVEVHGRRRIAFIRGPEHNEEAEKRYAAYQQALAEHGIEFDPQLVAMGDFRPPSGMEAIALLLDERKVSIDAVVAANDNMAITALEALQMRGKLVPGDVAVVGFDDIEESRVIAPALTTVRQPIFEQGARGIELVLSLIRKEETPLTTLLPTKLVLRASCGCGSDLPYVIKVEGAETEEGERTLALLVRRREQILSEMLVLLGTKKGDWETEQADALLSAIIGELQNRPGDSFVTTIDRILLDIGSRDGELLVWQSALAFLCRQVLALVADAPDLVSRAEVLRQEASMLIGQAIQRSQTYEKIRAERRLRTLSNLSRGLITTIDSAELINVLVAGLPRLKVRACYLSLYENFPSLEWSRLLVAYNENGRAPLPPEGQRYLTNRLVPRELLPEGRPSILVVDPLYFREEHLGFVAIEMESSKHVFYEELREQLSSAIKGIKREEERTRLHRAVNERARELETAYEALKDNQRRLLISEKMAFVGRLTAGIAHEMHTPLAAVRSALTELAHLAEDYRSSIGDQTVTAADHGEIASEMLHSINLAKRAATLAAGFVQGIKSQTPASGPNEKRYFAVTPVISDALLLLSHAVRQKNCVTTLDCTDDAIQLYGAPGRFAQVVTNLVTNAIDASVVKGGGPIKLSLTRDGDSVTFQVKDEGSGMPPEIVSRIFEPLFTTKPFGEGTGLGLAIIYDIVVGEFGGTVEVATEPGQGSTFTIRLPSVESSTLTRRSSTPVAPAQ